MSQQVINYFHIGQTHCRLLSPTYFKCCGICLYRNKFYREGEVVHARKYSEIIIGEHVYLFLLFHRLQSEPAQCFLLINGKAEQCASIRWHNIFSQMGCWPLGFVPGWVYLEGYCSLFYIAPGRQIKRFGIHTSRYSWCIGNPISS